MMHVEAQAWSPEQNLLRSDMLWVGIVLAVQGIGSFLTERIWDTKFGVTALLGDDAPSWVSLAIGVVGLIILAFSVSSRSRKSVHS
ncbi:hypothetical protein ACFVXC_31540 [Streptomyces sp. NPDC058257]|uniref:hypothetical protein n=1 Tax=Streptomyces sp. NPDC058257 TaxID=3346409 RepID=UPI0036ED8DA3